MNELTPPGTLPPLAPGARVRVLASADLLGTVLPLRTTYGLGGSIPGIIELFTRQQEVLPTLWMDTGDLTVGGETGLFGRRALIELPSLPISVAAVGNHELDDGPNTLNRFAATLPFPLLCADRDVGVPAATVVDTPHGPVGVVGMTHPHAHELAQAPPPAEDWADRVTEHAEGLRRTGARWVIALIHDGVAWWPQDDHGAPVATRSDALLQTSLRWAARVDAIVGGHVLAAWRGTLHGTPAGHAHGSAGSVLPIDLCEGNVRAQVYPPVRVPPLVPASLTPTMTAMRAADARVVGETSSSWDSWPGRGPYLPDLLATAIRSSSGAEAAFALPDMHWTQGPLDGVVAALQAGPVTDLDLIRLFPFDDDKVIVVDLRADEFQKLVQVHDGLSDPRNSAADALWWNWARAPAGTSCSAKSPETLAILAWTLPLVELWLGRDLAAHLSPTGGRKAVQEQINR